MQLTGCQNDEMHNAICMDTKISIEWPYCSFLYCAYVSHIKDMSLSEFQIARKLYCQQHDVPSLPLKCKTGLPLINAAKEVECKQIVKLRTLFCNHFKSSKEFYRFP